MTTKPATKQMEVTIMGQSYILACPEGGESSLFSAVASVDREMCAIRDAGKVRARERIAVLAALNLAYALAERHLPKTAAAPGPSVAATAGLDGKGVDLRTLARRLDNALADDGQLL